MIRMLLLVAVFSQMSTSAVYGQGRAKLAREAAEYLLERFGVEVGEQSIETLTERIAAYGLKYGDEAIAAIKTTGPRAFKLIEDAGENSPEVIRLLNKHGNAAVWVVSSPRKLAIFVKYGDEAAEALMKHPEVAEGVVDHFGAIGAKAMQSVSEQNGRRIAMMTDDGIIESCGKADELLGTIARYGDSAAEWVWKNKGALATTAVITAFVSDPEPFLKGAVEVVDAGGTFLVRPVAEQAAHSLNWNWAIGVGLAALCLVLTFRIGLQRFLIGTRSIPS